MKVYEVKVDWATEYGQDCQTELYSTEEKARKSFNLEKHNAMVDYGFEDDGSYDTNCYELEEDDNSWEFWESDYYNTCHCCITLTEKEVF